MSTESFTHNNPNGNNNASGSGDESDPFTSSQAHEQSSTQRIREETRAAVDQFRNEHPPRSSGASSSDRTAANGSEDPPDGNGRFAKAGMIATGAGQGGAAKAYLAQGNGRGWEGVEVPDKHGLMSPHLKTERKKVLKIVAGIFIFLALWMWACLSLFWGSTYHLQTNFHRLTVHLVPLDTDPDSFLVPPMINMAEMQNSLPVETPHFTYIIRQASDYPNGLEDVEREVLGQQCWAAVVINANATTAWRTAVENGDSSYSPNGAIGIYLQSARFYQVVLLYIQQTITSNLKTPLSTARASALRSFASEAANNQGLITNAIAVPQAIGTGFGYTIHDLRSIGNGQWGASAPMEAALIYFVIFAFYWTLFQAQGRMKSGLQSKLKLSSMVTLRLLFPIAAYFFFALWLTCIEAIWQVPMQNYLGRGGFPALWALNWVTIIAAGFAMETVQALVGIAGLPLFLILWIILNISSSFYPIEMMPTFYRFLYWMPFINNVEAYKIITFGTNYNHVIGKHFGILFGIIGVELIVYPLSIWFERWRLDRGMIKAKREKDERGEE